MKASQYSFGFIVMAGVFLRDRSWTPVYPTSGRIPIHRDALRRASHGGSGGRSPPIEPARMRALPIGPIGPKRALCTALWGPTWDVHAAGPVAALLLQMRVSKELHSCMYGEELSFSLGSVAQELIRFCCFRASIAVGRSDTGYAGVPVEYGPHCWC